MRTSPRRASWFLAIGLAAVVATWVAVRPQPRFLLARSTQAPAGLAGPWYGWLPDGGLLLQQPHGSMVPEPPRFTRLDRDGNPVQGGGLDESAQDGGARAVLSLSPDGARVLCVGPAPLDRGRTMFTACGLDGRSRQAWPRAAEESLTHALWLPDSRRFVTLTEQDHGLQARVRALGSPASTAVLLRVPPTGWQALGVTGSGVVLLYTQNAAAGPVSAVLRECPLRPGAPVKEWAVRVPPGGGVEAAEIGDADLSPRGDRVAWAVYYRRVPDPHPSWTQDLLRVLGVRETPPSAMSLWVSRLDGAGMHEVGCEAAPRPGAWPLSDVRWLPDGKRVSFTYGGVLFTVPIE